MGAGVSLLEDFDGAPYPQWVQDAFAEFAAEVGEEEADRCRPIAAKLFDAVLAGGTADIPPAVRAGSGGGEVVVHIDEPDPYRVVPVPVLDPRARR